MKKSIRRNYIYNLCYQILLIITPLITTPYLSRILGPAGIGEVSFAESIVAYFTLFAVLGITTYGQREISYVQDNKHDRSNVFWETKALEIISSLVVLVVYIPFGLLQNNASMYMVLSLNILAVTFDITWFFQGMEEFGKIVARNFFFKLINIIYIFTLIKTNNDTVLYALGVALFLFVSNVSLWFYLPKYIEKPNINEIHPFTNIKTVITLFIPTIAIQIYTVLDKTMIGIITQDVFENGYYEQAIKLSKMVMTIVTALGTVMIPRIGYHYGRGENEIVKKYMYRGYRFVWFLGIPLCFGLLGTASNFVPWFFGDEFEKVIPLLSVLCFLIPAIGINNVTGMQYLIPTKRQNIFTITVLIGACVNFILNLVLIRSFQSIGAAIASVTAETTIALVQLYLVREELSVKEVFTSSRHYLFAGGIMLFLLHAIGDTLSPSILNTGIMVIGGACIYLFVLLIIKDRFLIENVRKVVNTLPQKLRRR